MSRVSGRRWAALPWPLVGVAGNFFLNGLSFLAVLVALTRIRYPEPRQLPRKAICGTKLKQGFAYVFRQRGHVVAGAAGGHRQPAGHPVISPLFPTLPATFCTPTSPAWALLMACSGAGAFLGAITIAWVRTAAPTRLLRGPRYGGGFFVAIIAFTFSRNFYLSGFLLTVAGYCMIISVATINSLAAAPGRTTTCAAA